MTSGSRIGLHDVEQVEKEARQAGASGFLAKGTSLDDLIIVLREAADTNGQEGAS